MVIPRSYVSALLQRGWGVGVVGTRPNFDGRGCTACELQNPPIPEGDERTKEASKDFIPRGHPIPPPPSPISYRLPCSASQYSNVPVVVALLRKYTPCQLHQLSMSGCQNRLKYAV